MAIYIVSITGEPEDIYFKADSLDVQCAQNSGVMVVSFRAGDELIGVVFNPIYFRKLSESEEAIYISKQEKK